LKKNIKMKIILLLAASFSTLMAVAQPKIITQAIITTSTNVIAPDEEDDVTQIRTEGGREGGGGMGMRFANMFDGEMKSTTYIKNDMVKTDLKSESIKSTTFRDNATKTTTTFTEIMGNKNGIRSTDADQEIMTKRMDSMRKERMKTDTGASKPRMRNVEPEVSIVYLEETKKIAGYTCKKALLIQDKIIRKDTTVVWYNPEIKFANVASTGGMSGMGMFSQMMPGAVSFDKVNGFVMQYESKMPRGRKMEVKVTKIVTDKEIAATEFDMPKDIEVKNMKDMTGPGGGMRMIMGGRPN
jgi:GLPGLI family protein